MTHGTSMSSAARTPSLGHVTAWRPLSKRGQSDTRLDDPTEGLPSYLLGPVLGWFYTVCAPNGEVRRGALERLQLRFKLEPPLDWSRRGERAVEDLAERMNSDHEFGLDVLDYVLHHIKEFTSQYERPVEVAVGLATVLRDGGSAWEVGALAETGDSFQLLRRAIGPVREVIDSLPAASRAHRHLVMAWNRLSGRHPDESAAYREAVRAIEAAAKPVVLPKDDLATLGKMIRAMRDAPDKWTVTSGTVDDVRRMMEIVWTNQLDRHGTDDESVPLAVSPAQADLAVTLAVTLARLFAGGHVQRVVGS